METAIATKKIKSEKVTHATTSKFWESMEFHRFGIMPILLTVVGCIGGLAASFGAQADVVKLTMIAFPTIISLALMLAVAPMKHVVFASLFAIALDIITFLF